MAWDWYNYSGVPADPGALDATVCAIGTADTKAVRVSISMKGCSDDWWPSSLLSHSTFVRLRNRTGVCCEGHNLRRSAMVIERSQWESDDRPWYQIMASNIGHRSGAQQIARGVRCC